MSGRAVACIAAALGVAAWAGQVAANGAFPSSGQVLVHPTDPNTAWVSTSYGFARTTDGGTTFTLACESAIGYSMGFHPYAQLTEQGTLFMGLPDGLAVARGDACTFERASEVEGHFITDVSLDTNGRAIILAVPPGSGEPFVLESTDDLTTLTPLGVALPKKITVLTLEGDPQNPNTIFVSGILDANPPLGVLVRSLDAGMSWTTLLVPSSDAEHGPFIGGLDPDQSGRLFIRLNGSPGRLLMSEDFGETYEELVEIDGFLHAFRLTPDGGSVFYGGTLHGLSILDLATKESSQLSTLPTRCVTIAGERTYACFDQIAAGFAVGVAIAPEAEFVPFLNQACIDGLLACDAQSPLMDACSASWPTTQQQLDAAGECDGSGGGGSTGSTSTGLTTTSSSSSSTPGPASSSGGAGSDGATGGCECRQVPGRSGFGGLVLVAVGCLFARRRNCVRRNPMLRRHAE